MNNNRMENTISIQQTQRISLEILHTIASICEEQGFRYYLIYGTLIGAVRHHGYIPWDDDVDIMMPRPDYDQLLAYLYKNISDYPDLRVFNHDVNPDYPYMITRISDDRYRIVMANEKPYDKNSYVGCVVWLSGGKKDIFLREWFDEYIEAPFEEYTFRIPRAYDKVLRHIYGDYMKLPPENERVGHHDYQVYKK